MKSEKQSVDNMTISFADLKVILKRSKRKILFVVLSMALLAAWFSLTSPIRYRAEGSFQEKNSRSHEDGMPLIAMMAGIPGMSSENGTSVLMKSRKILEPVIRTLGLQGTLSGRTGGEREGLLSRIGKNIKLEYYAYSPIQHPLLADQLFPLQIREVTYNGEIPLHLTLKFVSDETFDVFDQQGVFYGHGSIGTSFVSDPLQFTLLRRNKTSLAGQTYHLNLASMAFAFKEIEGSFKVEADKKDKTLLNLNFLYHDRHVAALFLNELMSQYEQYLQTKLDEQSNVQLDYLRRRKEETTQNLSNLMKNHAQTLSKDYSNVGFADSQKEMEFLTHRQQRFQEHLLANQLEIKRLQNVNTDRCVYYDQHTFYGDPIVINKILGEIRDLKLQRNTLELALRQDPLPTNLVKLHILFAKQLDELANIQQQAVDIKALLAGLEEDKEIDLSLQIFNDSALLVRPWLAKLNDKKIAFENSPKAERERNRKEWQRQKESFIAYLENLQRISQVHEKVIQERLTHHQNPGMEFQGIDLKTAQELYIDYSKLMSKLEANIRQNTFVVKQLEDPHFEVSSLSSALEDPVGRETVMKSSQLVKDLHDENNRSGKEQDRIKEELALQRDFLRQHLRQTTQLSELTQRLYREKIDSLQNVTLELINQHLSVLNKNLIDYIEERLENLKQERQLLEQHVDEIHQQMATLPGKWATERMIQQEMESSRLIVEEIAKMVEKKNISHNLQFVQSAPLDLAIAPINPMPSRLLSYMIIGAIVGGLMSVSFVTVRAMAIGIPSTPEGLVLNKQYVAGRLSALYPSKPLSNQDLATLRRLQRYWQCDKREMGSNAMLLVEGNGPDYSSDLAAIMTKEGLRVIMLSLDFDQACNADDQHSLLNYLEGKASAPRIIQGEEGDRMVAGGVTRFGIEKICSDRFQSLLKRLQGEYDWVIATTHALPSGSEAECLSAIFSAISVTVTNETRQDLHAYLPGGLCDGKKVAFVFCNGNEG
jgi:tyrosine-protein kinase Etk/Wzc